MCCALSRNEAERALGLVRDGGRTVLQELTVLLGVLRRSGTSLPTAPTPSLHEVGALVDSFAAAGVKVDWQLPDSLGQLPDVIELTAYRIVQESLTNVLKHAPGAAAKIRLDRLPDSLAIDVTNTAPANPNDSKSEGAGHGLTGMRERVHAVGGHLSDRTGGWRPGSTCMLFFLTDGSIVVTIRVLLADDQTLMRSGFRVLVDVGARPGGRR